jgi:hypothetical protein
MLTSLNLELLDQYIFSYLTKNDSLLGSNFADSSTPAMTGAEKRPPNKHQGSLLLKSARSRL